MVNTQVDRLALIEARQGQIIAAVTDFGDRHPLTARVWGWLSLDFTGIAFATLFFCWSLSPSLLPRDWLFQGLIGGINAAIGYGVVGGAVGWVVDRLVLSRVRWWPPPIPVLRAPKVAVPVAAIVASLVALVFAVIQQRQLAALMSAEGTTTSGYLRTLVLAVAVSALLISVWRGLRDIGRRLRGN